MTYFYNVLPFPTNSRLTGVWSNTDIDPSADDEIASGHFLRLPDDQHGDVEADFLTSHMPFWVAALGGALPDGQPWLFVLQKAPADTAERLVGADNPAWVLRDSLFRALRFNNQAWVQEELVWSRSNLLDIYAWAGIDEEAVAEWPVIDLLRGLVAECCYADLADVVAGREDGCAFPGLDHECAGDVFTDVFARWGAGQMPSPEADLGDGEGSESAEGLEAYLKSFTRRDLEELAGQFDIRVRRAKSGGKRSRSKLIELILAANEGDEE